MKKLKWLTLFVILTLVLPLAPAAAQSPITDDKLAPPALAEGNWYIVEFEDASLATFAKSGAGFSAMTAQGKLDVNALSSQVYISALKIKQSAFGVSLARAIPGTEVYRGYQIALNAVAVRLPNSDLATLKALKELPGVTKISPQRFYSVDMDYSLPLINADAMWTQLGGRDAAGAGIKVAVIDSGIDPNHVLFDGTGWSYPTTGTWPKGYCVGHAGFCNGKIIAARYYAPTFEVNAAEELTPQDYRGHGTHTGGTAAGNRVTASYGTSTPEISGVAPGAWIMAYKGLFLNAAGTNATGDNIMLAAAVEDAIADGADVINNSWGSDAWELDDPLSAAYEAAADAGIVVVFSTGNSGPGYNTTGSPTSPKFIEVGASTTKRAYYNEIQVTAPTPVTDTLQSFAGNEFHDIDASAIPAATIGPLPYIPTDLEGNPDMMLPGVFPGITQTEPYSSTGWIALIPRGAFNFTLKLDNAIAQGASAAAMYTDARTWKGGFTAGNRAIYTVMIAHDIGLDARDWWATYTDTARIQIGYPFSAFTTETEDMIADFSSRGPALDLDIKPDVVAPGVNILSGIQDGTYAAWGGTSMAAPHVTGAAALLLALHPEWTPAQVKSALMTTASQTILNLDETTTADVMTQGSGRIDLSKADDPGLTFDTPSHSFGMLYQGTVMSGTLLVDICGTGSVRVTATDVSGSTEGYTVSVQEMVTDTGYVTVTVTPMTTDDGTLVMPGGTGVFTVTVEACPGATTQDLEGNIVVSGSSHVAHIPYWMRVAPYSENPILLIDDDLSGLGNADYQTYYTDALDALGLDYDVWDTTLGGWPGFPTRDVLDRYDSLVYFSGDDWPSIVYQAVGYTGGGTDEDLRNYLAAGGKMIAFGQDAAFALDFFLGAPFGAFFGARYSADDIFGGAAVPGPSAVGVAPFLQGKIIDFAAGGDGAGNMGTVDSLDVPNYVDVSNIALFEAPNTFPGVQGAGYLGAANSSDPTLERDADPIASGWWKLAYRTTFCSFGLEAVNDNTGYYTRTALLGDLFNYVYDIPAVAFNATSYFVETGFEPVNFSATATSNLGAGAVMYRWDFGDGSQYAATVGGAVSHQYQVPGNYYARVEVTDEYGHTAVSMPAKVIVGRRIFMPLMMRDYMAP